MWQRRFEVWYPGQEDGIACVVVVALEDELIPVGQIGAVFQENAQHLMSRAEIGLIRGLESLGAATAGYMAANLVIQ